MGGVPTEYLSNTDDWTKSVLASDKPQVIVDRESHTVMSLTPWLIYLDEFFRDCKIRILCKNELLGEAWLEVYRLLGFADVELLQGTIEEMESDAVCFSTEGGGFARDKKGIEHKIIPIDKPGIDAFRNEKLDINIGYVYELNRTGFDDNISYERSVFTNGIYSYESQNERYRIVVIGNSFTDDGRYEYLSWVGYMYDKIKDSGISVYNLAVSGFSSYQDIIRLLRDGMSLNPNLVICCNGFVDIFREAKQMETSYTFSPLSEIVVQNFNRGIIDKRDVKERLWSNILYMKAICESHGVIFWELIQPDLFRKKTAKGHEARIKSQISVLYGKSVVDSFLDYDEFVSSKSKSTDRFVDLLELTDDDMFIDMCHMCENGNKVIGNRIYELICGDIKQ